jgi:rare lipoprotein A
MRRLEETDMKRVISTAFLTALSACSIGGLADRTGADSFGIQQTPPVSADRPEEAVVQQRGGATYYADKFQGRKTATGETFHQEELTAASPSLPLGTRVTVTNQENGKSVDVRVNDRQPNANGRVIDLSQKAAGKLDMKKPGVVPVTVEARPSSQSTDELKSAVEKKVNDQK